jgi:hypothetical protein
MSYDHLLDRRFFAHREERNKKLGGSDQTIATLIQQKIG